MKMLIVCCVSLLALAGCGGTVCDRLKSAEDQFYAGKTECKYESGGATVTITRSTATCKTDGCSASDQTAMDNYASCLSKAQACTTGNEQKASGDATACGFALFASGISQSCQSNFAN